ncbi:hypothetical protein KSP40_PGU013395 [Platanthera guangdongensis]|uniref:DUF1279 domain-containing protein n=1 Tax=Platanthera guangdongensis TaxID=2320717 RepID=A0ABR2MP32_9ASPA
MARSSASVLERETPYCFLDFHASKEEPKNRQKPVTERRSEGSLAQVALEKAESWRELLLKKNRPRPGLARRIRDTEFIHQGTSQSYTTVLIFLTSLARISEYYGSGANLRNIFVRKNERPCIEKSKAEPAKELLAKYGGAYLATSITLSLISFSLCYLLISTGIDVQALLGKVGIMLDENGEKVGTFALAYAAHKAASPIRFSPTVALTPVVAGWIRKKSAEKNV